MFPRIVSLIAIILIFTSQAGPLVALKNLDTLPECTEAGNCFLADLKTKDVGASFNKLLNNVSQLPRSRFIESTNEYYHWTVKSLVFRFVDDVEVLKLPLENSIQIKSVSRTGSFDFGVNKKRVEQLSLSLTN